MRTVMLTTVDNPYDPFDDYENWYAFDQRMEYHTPGLLARIAVVSDDLSDADYDLAIEQAIDEIVEENISGMHRKVVKDVEENNLEVEVV